MTHDLHNEHLAEMSDWEEQDLLTVDEAGDRLATELATTRAELEAARSAGDAAATARLDARCTALAAALDRIRVGGTPAA